MTQENDIPADAPPAPRKVARIHPVDGTFLGMTEIEPALIDPAQHLDAAEIGGECDLPPGKYRWDRAEKTFKPIIERLQGNDPVFTPPAELALFGVIAALRRANIELPAPSADWADAYRKTIDARGVTQS